MIEIPLTKGKVAVVDDCDAYLMKFRWRADPRDTSWYAVRDRPGRGHGKVKLHREILGITDPAVEVDHINGDGLDCRRSNLRVASRAQNQHNQRRRRDNSSGYKGVQKNKDRWVARLSVDGKQRFLGYFERPVEAARVYDEAARKQYGEFAALNFPREGERAA